MTNEEVSLYLAMPDGERYRQLLLKDAEIERLRKGLEDAAYALFQLKRMTPDGAPEFARMASDRAQEVLEGHAHEPSEPLPSMPIVCRQCGSTDTMPWPQSSVKSQGASRDASSGEG